MIVARHGAPVVNGAATSASPHALTAVPLVEIRRALAGPGLLLDYGAASLRVRTDSARLAEQIQSVYGRFDFVAGGRWADLHIGIQRPRSLRRWLRPQVRFVCDGRHPFEPFPAEMPLPLLEWGGNWIIGQRLNDLLLLHAGAVERDGRALLLPALPGAGKSTLTAALSLSGWRLLSDEFGAYDPALGAFRALLKPIALKNASIDVIRGFAPQAPIGPVFPKTRKGTVAHLGADADAVARRGQTAAPAVVILPRWVADSAVKLEPIDADRIFPALAFNAFNYTLLGPVGFDAAVALARGCSGWTLEYGRLDEAVAAIDALWRRVVTRTAA